jgi:hypothetical protein
LFILDTIWNSLIGKGKNFGSYLVRTEQVRHLEKRVSFARRVVTPKLSKKQNWL